MRGVVCLISPMCAQSKLNLFLAVPPRGQCPFMEKTLLAHTVEIAALQPIKQETMGARHG